MNSEKKDIASLEPDELAEYLAELSENSGVKFEKFRAKQIFSWLMKGVPDFSAMSDQEIAVWYNDNVIYPDKVRLNCYYYRHYSFVKDIQMIFATVLGRKIWYAGEEI